EEQRSGGCPLPTLVVAPKRRTETFEIKKLGKLRIDIAMTLLERVGITDGEVVRDELSVVCYVAVEKKQCVICRHITVRSLNDSTCIGSYCAAKISGHR